MRLFKCIRGLVSENPFGSDRVNESQKLLKSSEKYFDPTFSSFLAELSCKKLILIRSEILELLLN